MKKFLDKLFLRNDNLKEASKNLRDLSFKTPCLKIFEAIESFSQSSEIRYVGGCVRKSILNEKIDDIDFATNLEPKDVCEALDKNEIRYYETGIDYGTITVTIDNYKFEITSLREDVSTDGRHALVKFSTDWKKDASRRDFTINAIYSDKKGNLFDPYNGQDDLKNGVIRFIGDSEKRIQEDYLRILRYLRFFLQYSKKKHKPEIISILKKNIFGISKLSKERLINELKKILTKEVLMNLKNDKLSLEIIRLIFPELKYFNVFFNNNFYKKNLLEEADFILLISLLIVDETDNVDYFLYKYKISKKDSKRIKNIHDFYKEKITSKSFSERNMNSIFYYKGKDAIDDILNFKIIKSSKIQNDLIRLAKSYKDKTIPNIPIKADILMKKYQIPEGKILGEKLKKIETEWVNNNFRISDNQIKKIIEI